MRFIEDRSLIECARQVLLGEELDAGQKGIVDYWMKTAPYGAAFSDHLFPPTSDRLYIPLLKSNDNNTIPHEKVLSHLSKHGYDISDYSKGLVTDKHERQVRIGKVLEQTNADPEVKKAFINDQSRNNTKHKDLMVCVTRHPYDVAGMSTDRGWTSCMHFETGDYAPKLEQAVTHGSHVAYLIHKDDKNIQNPIARITLNPHISLDKKHTILHPEDKSYGSGHGDFSFTVRKWAQDSFPMVYPYYKKDKAVYNDDNKKYLVSNRPEHVNALLQGNQFERGLVASSNRDSGIMHHLSNDPSRYVRAIVAGRYYDHINDRLVNDPDHHVRRFVAYTGEYKHLNTLVNDPHPQVRIAVAVNQHKEHLDHLVNDHDPHVRAAIALFGSQEHHDKLMHDHNIDVRQNVAIYGSEHHTKYLLNDPDPSVKDLAQRKLDGANFHRPLQPPTTAYVPYDKRVY